VCPVQAIRMVKDEMDFEYAQIDETKCIRCGKCLKVCSEIAKPVLATTSKPAVYSCWNKDENTRLMSTSGGIFSALARAVIKAGGYVCGAVYNEQLLVEHRLTNRLEDIEKLRQSKYIQSNLKDVFPQIKTLLQKGEKVLFAGSPCQCAGLRKYLGAELENLILVDFICLGVNAPKAYKKYLQFLEEKYRSKIVSVQFKNKDFGWNTFHTKVVFEDGQIYYGPRKEDPFYKGFIGAHSLYFRESCYNCSFKGFPRMADISLGDFWGVSKKYDADKGTSVVMLNSAKAERLFEAVKPDIVAYKQSLKTAERGNPALHICKPMPGAYKQIKKDLQALNFGEFIAKYTK